jgi:hypothetical protein
LDLSFLVNNRNSGVSRLIVLAETEITQKYLLHQSLALRFYAIDRYSSLTEILMKAGLTKIFVTITCVTVAMIVGNPTFHCLQ